jgi:hypothetical protein
MTISQSFRVIVADPYRPFVDLFAYAGVFQLLFKLLLLLFDLGLLVFDISQISLQSELRFPVLRLRRRLHFAKGFAFLSDSGLKSRAIAERPVSGQLSLLHCRYRQNHHSL